MPASACPGCDGPKSPAARLCRSCRRRAELLGERALLDRNARTIPSRPRTAQQNTAYHAKLGDIGKLTGEDSLDLKEQTLELASAMFDREVTSSTQLTEIEMEQVNDRLDEQLKRLRAAAPEPAGASGP